VSNHDNLTNLRWDELVFLIRRLNKNFTQLKKALSAWDKKTNDNILKLANENINQLGIVWETLRNQIISEAQDKEEILKSETYPASIEKTIQEAGLKFKGEFPNYEITPFKLNLNINEGTVRLSLGRKSETTGIFEPNRLAAWIANHYKSLVEKRFDSQRFCRDLLAAYEYGNKIAYHNDKVLWGKAVSIFTIYDLMTGYHVSRQIYPKNLFSYELGRLKEQYDICYKEYRFDFGQARNPSHGLVVVDSYGRESRISSLIIYKGDE